MSILKQLMTMTRWGGLALAGIVSITLHPHPAHSQEPEPTAQTRPVPRAELEDRAVLLSQQALRLQQAQRYDEAEALYQQWIAIEQQLGRDRIEYAIAIHNLANLYRDMRRYSEAEVLFQQSLSRIERQVDATADVQIRGLQSTFLHNFGTFYLEAGRFNEAVSVYQTALEIRATVFGTGHSATLASLNNLAEAYRELGLYDDAEPLYQTALSWLDGQPDRALANRAVVLKNLGSLYTDRGRYREALTYLEQALTMAEQAWGNRHGNVGNTLTAIAEVYRLMGQYEDAESLYNQALAICDEHFGSRHPDTAIVLNNLALLYAAMGRNTEALPLFQTSFEILKEQLGLEHPITVTTVNNQALVYKNLELYEFAEPLFRIALAVRQDQLGGQHPLTADSLANLAGLYDVMGLYEQAEPLYRQALAIQEPYGDTHPGLSVTLNNLAGLYRDTGRYPEAVALFQRALAIRQQHLGANHPSTAIVLSNLAGLALAQASPLEALTYLRQGLQVEDHNLSTHLPFQSEREQLAYLDSISRSDHGMISLHLQHLPDNSDASQLALLTLLQRKGRILDVVSDSYQRLRHRLTGEYPPLLDQLSATRQELARLIFSRDLALSPNQYQARLTQLEAQANQLERRLSRQSSPLQAQSQPVDMADIAAQLPPSSVLVEYFRYRPFDATTAVQRERFGPPRYAAYLLFPDSRIAAIDLGDAAAIDEAIQAFTQLLQAPSATLRGSATVTVEPRPDRVAAASNTLSDLILAPIAPYLQDVAHLVISPDGELNRLPFEALQPERGGDYLVQRYQISYLTSGRDLLKFDLTPPSTQPAVVIANPDYEKATVDVAQSRNIVQVAADLASEVQPASGGKPQIPRSPSDAEPNRRSPELSQLQFGPLPGTAAEVDAIESLLPDAIILTTEQATETALKQVQAPRILHIATHGFFLPTIDRPSDRPSPGSFNTSVTTNPLASVGIPVENPLLRSGLALAGFNSRSSGDDDGVLTALEAANLNLFGTQLVVLSACDTGVGAIANGEGVYGLRRALAIAGANTQVMSLWQVSDRGTQTLMARYYERLMAGMGRSEALRAVQLEMINAGGPYSHPYYWAAFILAGDWRPLE